MNFTPHVGQDAKRTGGSALDGCTTGHAGYAVSQRKRIIGLSSSSCSLPKAGLGRRLRITVDREHLA